MRVLRIQIAEGFHAEAKADGTLLRNLDGDDRALIFCHYWAGDRDSAGEIEAWSGCRTLRFDTGWRPPGGERRSPLFWAPALARFAWAFPRMLWHAWRWKPDVIDSSQQKWDCAVATLISWLLRKPHVIHLHYTVPWIGSFARRRLVHCARVVAVAQFVADQAAAIGAERVTTILNAMDPPPEAPPGTREAVRREFSIPPGAPLIGIVGRLVPWKGQADTIRALARCGERQPNTHLLIVGDGPAREDLERLAGECGLADRVHFARLPYEAEPRVLAALDVFSFPSRDDICPLSVLKALAAGTPVVAYDEGGVPELVGGPESGVLVPPGDVQALADALDALLRDPRRRSAVGAAARERVRTEFSPADAGRAYCEVLRDVTGRV